MCAQLPELASDIFTVLPAGYATSGEFPDPTGPLSLSLSPSVIEGTNSAVTSVRQERLTLMKTAKRPKRGPYM